MDMQIVATREINTTEMSNLQKQLVGLWASQINNNIRFAASNLKAKTWMAANSFTKIVDKITGEKTVEILQKGAKLGAGITIGTALLATPYLPALPMLAAGTTVGSYMAAVASQAINKLNSKVTSKVEARLNEAQVQVANSKQLRDLSKDAYNTVKEMLAEERAIAEKEREAELEAQRAEKEAQKAETRAIKEQAKQQREEERSQKREERRVKMANFRDDVILNWEIFKEEQDKKIEQMKIKMANFRDDIILEWEITKEEFAELKKQVKEKTQAKIDVVKEKYNEAKETVTNKVNQAKETVQNRVNQVKEKGNEIKQNVTQKVEQVKGAVSSKIGEIKSNIEIARQEAEERRERIKAEKEAARQVHQEMIEQRREEKRQVKIMAEEQARIDAERYAKEKQERQEAKAIARSKKCLNFLVSSTSFLGKDFIASRLLNEEDKKSYDGIRRAIAEEREIQAEKINNAIGTTFSANDLARMSDKQIARIEKQIQIVNNSQLRHAEATI